MECYLFAPPALGCGKSNWKSTLTGVGSQFLIPIKTEQYRKLITVFIMFNESNLRPGERLLQEAEVDNLTFNERSQQRYAINTVIDLTGNTLYVAKPTNRGDNLTFITRKIAGFGTPSQKVTEESRVPAGMILRCPFEDTDRQPLLSTTECERAILACWNETSPGTALKKLLKGRRIKVVYDIECQDKPYGKDAKEAVKFNVWDWA